MRFELCIPAEIMQGFKNTRKRFKRPFELGPLKFSPPFENSPQFEDSPPFELSLSFELDPFELVWFELSC